MKKLFVAIILIFSLVIPTVASTASATSTVLTKSVKDYGYSTVNRTIYKTESTHGEKLGTLKKKTHVYVYSTHKGFYKVRFNHKIGYIPTKRLRLGFADGWKLLY